MSLQVFVFVFLFVVCLLFSLTLLWRLDWFPLRPPSSRGGDKRTTLHRLLKPRTPVDCPACRLGSTPSSGAGPASAPVRPWSEMKSRRGAPKRINTQGYACPNRNCPYFGNTDARFHALVGDGKHGQAERIQTFRCQACRSTFTARRDTPLYRLKTPSQQVAMVRITPSPKGWILPRLNASSAIVRRRSPAFLTRAGRHAESLHERCFRNLHIPHLQLDELRTRLRSAKHVLWLWLVIDPRTRDSACASARSSNAKHGTPAHPFLATDLGRLSASRSLRVTNSISPSLPSRLTLVSGSRWVDKGTTCESRQVEAGLIYGQVKKS